MNSNRSALLNSRILPSIQWKKKKVSHSSTSVSARAFGIQAAPAADLQTLQNTSSAHGAWSCDGGWIPVVLWTSGLICSSHTDQHFWQAEELQLQMRKSETDMCSIMSLVFWLRNRLSFFICKYSFKPQLDHEQKQTKATLCLLFCVNSLDLYHSTLISVQVCGSWINLPASNVELRALKHYRAVVFGK